MSEYDVFQDLIDFFSSNGRIVVSLFGQMLSIGVSVFMVVVYWFLFQKAHEPGWASLIPYYNQYIAFKVAGKKNLFWAWLAVQIVYLIAAVVMAFSMIMIFATGIASLGYGRGLEYVGISAFVFFVSIVVVAIALLAMFVFMIFQAIGIAKNFQAGGGFAVGIIFFPYVFLAILAFSQKYQYRGEGWADPNIPQFPYGQFIRPEQMPPQYNQPVQYGQPQYNQPVQYGQPQYNQPVQYGQPQYNQPVQYGQSRDDQSTQYSQPQNDQSIQYDVQSQTDVQGGEDTERPQSKSEGNICIRKL